MAALGSAGAVRTIPAAGGSPSAATGAADESAAADGGDPASASGTGSEAAGGAGSPAGSGVDAGSGSDAGTGAEGSGIAQAPIYVHLVGAIVRPGLYELDGGSRAVDAVAAAGGFTPDADQAQVNLARLVSDGEQIVVPVIGQTLPVAIAGKGAGASAAAMGPVNLNIADAAALDTLPGIGPATAQRILDWRKENGRFTSVEDLLSVSGIGEKTLADLRDLVTV
ncbi:MAG: ComEA family DNA-binding protein [Burkholderiaceae bacterium]|nr:ComEA family DNA-binding protein [Microbacteriaceae bacterium]